MRKQGLSETQRRNLISTLKIEKELQRRNSKTSLYAFTKYLWEVIEPETSFVDGWHIKALCDHLEAVSRFEIPKLIINMPPRHMKSIICSVMFPAWVWGERPELSFIYGSHSADLATRDSIKTRQVITSEKYMEVFNQAWSLIGDQNQKTVFENTKHGVRKSVGVGSGITGQGGDFLFIDDPMNASEAHSVATREEVVRWHDNVLSTRINNPRRYAKVIVMQRLTEGDLTDHVLKKDAGYQHLILPAEYNPKSELKSNTILNFKDPRTREGELLWPEHWGQEAIDDAKTTLGDDAEAQLNQNPKPASGGLIPKEFWRRYEAAPSPLLEVVLFIDSAQKPGISNDYSVFATWGRTHNGYYLLDLMREKTDAPLLEALTLTSFNKWRHNEVIIEDKSSGSSLIQHLRSETTIPVTAFNPGQRDKVVRATAAKPTIKNGKCFLPSVPIKTFDEASKKEVNLIDLFVKEHERFPKSAHDDMVDTTSMAIEHFSKRQVSRPRVRSLV